MFPVHDIIQSSLGVDSMITNDTSAFMMPMIGPTGEVLYYVPTAAANTSMTGASTLPFVASAQSQPQLTTGPLRMVDQFHQSVPNFIQQTNSADSSFHIQSLAGSMLPLCSVSKQQQLHHPGRFQPPELETHDHQRNIFNSYLPSSVGKLTSDLQHHHQQQQHSVVLQQNLEIREIISQISANRDEATTGQIEQPISGIMEKTMSTSMPSSVTTSRECTNSDANTLVTSPYLRHQNAEQVSVKAPIAVELGPVEKAVFQQALYNQKKKRNSKASNNGQTNIESQVQCDMRIKTKKHSRTLLENRVGLDQGRAEGVSVAVINRGKSRIDIKASELKTFSAVADNNYQLAAKTPSAQSSKSSIREEGAISIQSGAVDTDQSNLGDNRPNGDSPLISVSSTVKTHLGAYQTVRYHPYARSQNFNDNAKDCNTINSTVIHNDGQVTQTRSSSNTQAKDGETPRHCQQPSLHIPTTLVKTTNFADAVHSVVVPKADFCLPFSTADNVDALNASTATDFPGNDTLSKTNDLSSNATSAITDEKAQIGSNDSEQSSEMVGSSHGTTETIGNCDDLSQKFDAGVSCNSENGRDSSMKNRISPSKQEVILPDPLPSYITKIDKPPSRVLKESLHCTTCEVYVNSDNQMKQHLSSLRHKNTLQGIPTPPKPGREEKPKLRAEQYRCNICKVTLNSDIQLSQHLASQRHRNILEGKPPKPRWTPYERSQQQQLLVRSATTLRLPFAATPAKSPLTTAGLPLGNPGLAISLPDLASLNSGTVAGHYLTAPSGGAQTHLKQASFVLSEGGMIQAREIVYVGAQPIQTLPQGGAFPASLPTIQGILPRHQMQLPHILAAPTSGIEWA